MSEGDDISTPGDEDFVERVEAVPKDETVVARITDDNDEVIDVSKAVYDTMYLAVEPVLDYLFPHTPEEIEAFNWNDVVPEDPSTYPKGINPSPEEYSLVKKLYDFIKKEKDELAKKQHGAPKSNVQSYVTFRQKWGHIRQWAAVYRYMHPEMTQQTVYDLIKSQLKLCGSVGAVNDVIKNYIIQFLSKKKRESRKKKVTEDLTAEIARLDQKTTQTNAKLEAARVKEAEIQEEKRSIAANLSGTAAQRKKQKAKELKKVAKTEKQNKKELRTLVQAKKRLEKEKAAMEKAKEQVTTTNLITKNDTKKVANRNNLALLAEALTPRAKADREGDDWDPPKRANNIRFDPPGQSWMNESIEKVKLLIKLARALKDEDQLDLTPSFPGLMAILDLGDEADFLTRAFVYLMGLEIYLNSGVDIMVSVLLEMIREGLEDPVKIAAATVQQFSGIVGRVKECDNTVIATDLHKIATALGNNPCPMTLEGLVQIEVSDTAARLMMQQVFGAGGIVFTLHVRKVIVALDLIDWEAACERKVDLKMSDISAAHARNSVSTWLPRDIGQDFQESLDGLGLVLGKRRNGFQGKLTATVNKHFSTKEKKKVMDMTDTITQFYKATKSGGRSKIIF